MSDVTDGIIKKIADAKKTHKEYEKSLDQWDYWLNRSILNTAGESAPTNQEVLLQYVLIRDDLQQDILELGLIGEIKQFYITNWSDLDIIDKHKDALRLYLKNISKLSWVDDATISKSGNDFIISKEGNSVSLIRINNEAKLVSGTSSDDPLINSFKLIQRSGKWLLASDPIPEVTEIYSYVKYFLKPIFTDPLNEPKIEKIIEKLEEIFDEISQAGFLRGKNQKIQDIERNIRTKRNRIEENAKILVEILESSDFLNELEKESKVEQVKLALELNDRLSETSVGKLYLKKSYATLSSLNHPQRIQKYFSTLDVTSPILKKASKYIATYYEKFSSTIFELPENEFIDSMYDYILTFDKDIPTRDSINDLDDLSNLVNIIQLKLDTDDKVQDYFSRFVLGNNIKKIMGSSFLSILSSINFYHKVTKFKKNPTLINSWELIQAARSISKTYARTIKYFLEATPLREKVTKIGKRFSRYSIKELTKPVKPIFPVLDFISGAVKVHEAWQTKDYDVAKVQAASTIGSAFIAFFVTAPVASFLAGATLGMIIAILMVYSNNSELVKWYQFNYLGKDWGDVDQFEDPISPSFQFRSDDGSGYPNINRQISEFLSIKYGFTVEEATLEAATLPAYKIKVKIQSRPKKTISLGSDLIIKSLFRTPVSGGNIKYTPYYDYTFFPIETLQPKDNDQFPTTAEFRYKPAAITWDGDFVTDFYEEITNVPYGLSDYEWLEVEVMVPSKLGDFTGTDPTSVVNDYPFVLRARKKIER